MTDRIDKHDDNKFMNPAVAGLAGLAIGVVAGAAALALSDQKTRKRVLNKADQLGQKAQESMNQATEKVNTAVDRVRTRAKGLQDQTGDQVEEMTDKAQSLSEQGGDAIKDQVEKNRKTN
jgi:siroheme synthase (precorrin-2 oxidase/ferrochelatase)